MFFSSQLVEALKADHKKLQAEINLLKETDISDRERQLSFARFLPILVSHTKREENVVYNYMKSLKDDYLSLMAYEGKTKHMIAEQLIEDMLSDRLINQEWSASAKVLAELVEQHIEEEEHEVFPVLKRSLDSEMDLVLCQRFESTRHTPYSTAYTQEFESEAPRWS